MEKDDLIKLDKYLAEIETELAIWNKTGDVPAKFRELQRLVEDEKNK